MNPSWSETWGEELSKIQDLQKRLKQNNFNRDENLAEKLIFYLIKFHLLIILFNFLKTINYLFKTNKFLTF